MGKRQILLSFQDLPIQEETEGRDMLECRKEIMEPMNGFEPLTY